MKTIKALKDITTTSVEKMNSSSETLYLAASEFTQAGQGVKGVFEQAVQVVDHLSNMTKNSRCNCLKTVELTVSGYEKTRSDLASMLGEIKNYYRICQARGWSHRGAHPKARNIR